jgi:hypothetical protein
MKTEVMCLILLAHIACARTNATPWTFQWDGTVYGLYFEDTNLTATARTVIRDDTARILSYNSASNATLTALPPSNPRFGQYAGVFSLSGVVCPPQFDCRHYNSFGGTNYLVFPAGMTSAYLSHIAMASQAAVAFSTLSNFVHAVNHVSTNTFSRNTFASLFWSTGKNRVATRGDFEEQGADYLFVVNDLAKFCFGFQSILDFETESGNGEIHAGCSLIFRRKTHAAGMWSRWPIVYKEGQWRLIPAYEMQ